jgi:5-methylthioadenosine/S-adenosylhomocysteine deaminase
LVNAHTHLELTGFEGLAAEEEFTDWIRTIIRLKAERSSGDFLAASNRGLQDCFAAGVTTVADTGDSGAPFDALLEQGGSGIAYFEVFGPAPAVAQAQFAAFRDRICRLRDRQTDRVRLGVSPHAPYSVSGRLYELVARFAEEEQLPIAVHVAESAAESALLEQASGGFAAQWKQRDIPLPTLPGRTPLAWLNEHGVLGPHTLCIHAVRAGANDVRQLVQQGCAVAHCPRSNRRHGHGDAPIGVFLSSGLAVGVGTDSAASVAPLDLLAEVRAARALAGLSSEQALDLAMRGAARALGMDSDLGSLAIGKWADCTVVEVPAGLSLAAVPEAILASRTTDVIATFVGGREVYRRT